LWGPETDLLLLKIVNSKGTTYLESDISSVGFLELEGVKFGDTLKLVPPVLNKRITGSSSWSIEILKKGDEK
jgi:hypothetical protein